MVFRKLANTGKIEQKQPGLGTVWGQTPQYRRDLGVGGMPMVLYLWESRSSETARVRAPASRLGGGTLAYWKCDREREAAAGVAALVPR